MRSLGQPVGSLAADLIGVSMITCKNDRLLELLWFVGYCIEFPTQLAVRIGGGAEWNRRVMYRAIREGYVRLYRKKHKRHVIRSMSLTQKGFEYVAQRDPEAVSMIYSRVNSSERIYPGWIDKILRLHAIAIGTVMSNAAGAVLLISQSHLSCRLPKEQRMRSCRIPTKSITTPHTSCVSPSRSTPRSQYPRAHARSVLSSKGGVASFFTSQGVQECTG